MLKEYKEVFLQAVSSLPNYNKIDQIELADKYTGGGVLKDAYLAAIVLRYWNIIEKLVYKDYGLYDPKEAYDWFMDALLYVLSDQPWKREGSSVYNDPKGLEKSLNTCIKCSRANWFQASNRHKRRINHNVSSLDALEDEYKDACVPQELVVDYSDANSYKYLVLEYFNKQQYLLSLIIDVIVNDLNLEKCKDNKALIQNIKRSIRSLPEDYSHLFAINYGLEDKLVEKSFSYIYNMSDHKLRQAIENYIYRLKAILKSEER